ncbi:hypothetical protein D3C76_1003050 [compost metagenome]
MSPICSGVFWSSAPAPVLCGISPVRKVQATCNLSMLPLLIWSSAAKRLPAVVLPQWAQSFCSVPGATGVTAGSTEALTTWVGTNM